MSFVTLFIHSFIKHLAGACRVLGTFAHPCLDAWQCSWICLLAFLLAVAASFGSF